MKDEITNNLASILGGSKEYSFKYGDYGMTVLKLRGYYNGREAKIDLGKLIEEYPDVMEDIIVIDEEEE